MANRPRPKAVLLVLLVVVLVNLPFAEGAVAGWRIDRSGVDVTAAVVDHGILAAGDHDSYLLAFRFARGVDPKRASRTAEVDHATYDRDVADRTVAVRVLPGNPDQFRVEGQVTHRTGLVLTAIADVVLLLLVLLLWRYRGRLRPQLQAVATGDVEGCPPGSALDRLEGDLYLIRGEVSRADADEIVLDLGDRSVRVLLDGHANPVGHRHPAQVHGRLIG